MILLSIMDVGYKKIFDVFRRDIVRLYVAPDLSRIVPPITFGPHESAPSRRRQYLVAKFEGGFAVPLCWCSNFTFLGVFEHDTLILLGGGTTSLMSSI
eukprot:m.83180 g.83180  ORF g.83180 m.83180 type:complete len:98 (-) comp25602_c0_seq2:175-468(-)